MAILRVLRLGGWSPLLPTGYLVSRGTQEHQRLNGISPSPRRAPPDPLRGSHPLRRGFPPTSRGRASWGVFPGDPRVRVGARVLQPRRASALRRPPPVWADPVSLATTPGVSLRPTRAQGCRLVPRHLLIPLPRGTEMFQFPRFPPSPLRGSRPITDEGLPHSGSDGSSLACSSPSTFRRSPRPSSAPGP